MPIRRKSGINFNSLNHASPEHVLSAPLLHSHFGNLIVVLFCNHVNIPPGMRWYKNTTPAERFSSSLRPFHVPTWHKVVEEHHGGREVRGRI